MGVLTREEKARIAEEERVRLEVRARWEQALRKRKGWRRWLFRGMLVALGLTLFFLIPAGQVREGRGGGS